MYDIGSATTEVADKYILSLIVSPSLLVIYFFVRKISSATTIILEPFYASKFKDLASILDRPLSSSDLSRPLVTGYLVAAISCVLSLMAIKVLSFISLFQVEIIPSIVMSNIGIFSTCLFIDASIAANRWGRHISLLNGQPGSLLIVRWLCFIIFVLVVMKLPAPSETISLTVGFLLYAFLEFVYVVSRTCTFK